MSAQGTGNKKPHQLPDEVWTCLTAVTAGHKAHKTHKDYAMNQTQNATQQQLCINHCPEAKDGEPCAHCVLVTAVEAQRDAEREDEAFELLQRYNACRTTQIVEQLDQSIDEAKELTAPMLDHSSNCADLLIFAWVALFFIVAVMWAFGQSKTVASVASMCGGAM